MKRKQNFVCLSINLSANVTSFIYFLFAIFHCTLRLYSIYGPIGNSIDFVDPYDLNMNV